MIIQQAFTRSLTASLVSFLFLIPLLVSAAPAGEGASFDGQRDHLRVDLGPDRNLGEVTVAAWVKLEEGAGTQVFMNRGARGELFTLYLFDDHVRMLVEYAPRRYRHASAAPPPANEWVHYAGTYDGENITLFVDGEAVDSTSAKGKIPVREDLLIIGASTPFIDTVNGRMEDVRMYRSALSPAQVGEVVAGGEPAANSLIFRYTAAELEERKSRDHLLPTEGEPTLPFAMGRLATTDGFRGIWYVNQSRADGLHKYSGGLGTYPQQHIPIAIYAEAVNKTFFTYGGARKDGNRLLHMVSAYDHETGLVARPRILLDKKTDDAHDNPVMSIDDDGYIWIFSNAHGRDRDAYIHRSTEPYSIEAFENKVTTNFSYSQPWYIPEHGFVFLQTLYLGGTDIRVRRRALHLSNSEDGINWTEPRVLADIRFGQYQISWPRGSTVGTAFNYHPDENSPLGRGLDFRTNLYYMETPDGGKTWRNVKGEELVMPLTEPDNPALAVEYESQGWVNYLKDIQYTAEGHPVILHLTTRNWRAGQESGPRTFVVAHWNGSEWLTHPVTSADNNYDFASLYIEDDGTWRVIGSTEVGPQPWNTGGEMAMWVSRDEGKTWQMTRQMTRNSEYNHTYPRRPLNAHPDFYALWADGHGRELSPSRFYFSNRDGDVFKLPFKIEDDSDWVAPKRLP